MKKMVCVLVAMLLMAVPCFAEVAEAPSLGGYVIEEREGWTAEVMVGNQLKVVDPNGEKYTVAWMDAMSFGMNEAQITAVTPAVLEQYGSEMASAFPGIEGRMDVAPDGAEVYFYTGELVGRPLSGMYIFRGMGFYQIVCNVSEEDGAFDSMYDIANWVSGYEVPAEGEATEETAEDAES